MFWRALVGLLLVTVISVYSLPLQPPKAVHAFTSPLHITANDANRYRRHANDVDDDADVALLERFRREVSAGGDDKRGFQPWGGKRQAELPEAPWTDADDDEMALTAAARAFNPWGGKRSRDADKRAKFQPWGGKRDGLKRKFQPWGGKRQAVPDLEQLKRRFNPWAGKRSSSDAQLDLDQQDQQHMDDDVDEDGLNTDKRGFQPWGGKRSSFQPWGGKRASFQPWGGKRSSFQPWGGKRDSFQPWGGKRASFQPWGGKRGFQPWGGKRAFQPWGGKRSTGEYDDELEAVEAKRQAFNAWGGKRSMDTEPELSQLFDDSGPTRDLN